MEVNYDEMDGRDSSIFSDAAEGTRLGDDRERSFWTVTSSFDR